MPGYDLRGIKGDSLPYGKASKDGEIDNTEVFFLRDAVQVSIAPPTSIRKSNYPSHRAGPVPRIFSAAALLAKSLTTGLHPSSTRSFA